jgi:hypothetical protein
MPKRFFGQSGWKQVRLVRVISQNDLLFTIKRKTAISFLGFGR